VQHDDASDRRAVMYCRKCDYPLRTLEGSTCPECGTPFDRDDPATYRALRRHSADIEIRLWVGSALMTSPVLVAGPLVRAGGTFGTVVVLAAILVGAGLMSSARRSIILRNRA
jgi:hypothetical protein